MEEKITKLSKLIVDNCKNGSDQHLLYPELTASIAYEIENLIKDLQPTDEEVGDWYDENIIKGCSASSAIYKFRLFLKERI